MTSTCVQTSASATASNNLDQNKFGMQRLRSYEEEVGGKRDEAGAERGGRTIIVTQGSLTRCGRLDGDMGTVMLTTRWAYRF